MNIVYRVTYENGETIHTGHKPLAEVWAKRSGAQLDEITLHGADGYRLQPISEFDAVNEMVCERAELRKAIALAYGWLWHATTSDRKVHIARKALLQHITKGEQKTGIQRAKNEGAEVDSREIEAQMLRGFDT